MAKPIFQSVVDLGLRDVGVRNDVRRLATGAARAVVIMLALFVVSVLALCVIVSQTKVGAWVVVPFVLAWAVGIAALALGVARRSVPMVVKVGAEGPNQATWIVLAHLVLVVAAAVVVGNPLLIPAVVLTAIIAVPVLRGRHRMPEAVDSLRTLLGPGEAVLGDGIGLVRGVGAKRASVRLVVATDRRLLLTTGTASDEQFVLIDAPYRDLAGFGIEWGRWGRVGVLSVTVPGRDGEPETRAVGSIAPLNLLSIARALLSHEVPTDDADLIGEAAREWEEAQRREPPRLLLDRAAMTTAAFDRGLWLLLALSAATFYLAPAGLEFAVLAVVGAVCLVSGYVSGTRASIAYIAPLNLLATPAFFFADAGGVLLVMVMLSLVGVAGLVAGATLRRRATGEPQRRSGLRYAISGLSLVRVSSVLLAVLLSLVVVGAAAGLGPRALRLAFDELTAKRLPADGRSNLTGNAASLAYTPGPGLREFVKDEHWDAGPNDGARWELRTSFTRGDNMVSLAHYIFEPRLDDPAAVSRFVAGKDDEHSRIAGHEVTHTTRVVDGQTGYIWRHASGGGYWHYVAWFPQPIHTIRLECVANTEVARFKGLCAEAIASLEFHP